MTRFSLFLFFLFVLSAHQSYAQAPTNQLIAWFHMDSLTIHDGTGKGSVGTAFGQPELVCGVHDLAVRFDGVDDALLFIGPINEVFEQNSFTVSFYFKPVSQPGTQLILAKQDYSKCSPKPAFWVRYSFNSNSISTGISDDKTSATVAGRLDEGRCWQLVTIVRNVKNYSIYINGKLKGSTDSPDRVNLTDDNTLMHVGEPVCPTDRWMRGFLDDLRFYNRALDQDDINKLNLHPDELNNQDTIIFLGNSVIAEPTRSCSNNFEWSPVAGVSDPSVNAPTITPTVSGTYRLNFKDQFCIAYDSFNIKVIDPSTLDCGTIFIPNAFTPGNSIGRNDLFGISNPFAISEFISFEIFDRWGGRMFNGKNSFDMWDGNFNSNPVNAGNYLYRLKFRCEGEERVKAGTVILIR
jgi:gliding motility-associated-like protein